MKVEFETLDDLKFIPESSADEAILKEWCSKGNLYTIAYFTANSNYTEGELKMTYASAIVLLPAEIENHDQTGS